MLLSPFISGSYYSQEFLRDLKNGPLSQDGLLEDKQAKEEAFRTILSLYDKKTPFVFKSTRGRTTGRRVA